MLPLKLIVYLLAILLQLISADSVSTTIDKLATNHGWVNTHPKKEELEQLVIESLRLTESSNKFGNAVTLQKFTSSGPNLIAIGQWSSNAYTYLRFKLEKPIKILERFFSFDREEDARKLAESMANINFYKPLLKFDAEFVIQYFGPIANVESFHDFPQVDEGFPEYKKKFGVILKYGETDFRFGICAIGKTFTDDKNSDIPAADKFLVLGVSQKSCNKAALIFALEDGYFNHPDAFGRLACLPSFYSGEEKNQEKFFSGKINRIRNLIRETLQNRDMIGKITVHKSWSIVKNRISYNVGLFKFSKEEGTKVTDLFFFVAHDSTLGLISTSNTVVGPFHIEEFNATQNIADFVKGSQLKDFVNKENLFEVKSTENALSTVDILIWAIDYAARKFTFRNRGDADKTPFVYKGLDIILN